MCESCFGSDGGESAGAHRVATPASRALQQKGWRSTRALKNQRPPIGGGPEVLIYSRAPIASTGRARSARLVGSARAKSARSAEMPRIAANGLAGMYGRPPLSAWLSGSSAVAAIARPMPSPIRRVVRSSLLLRSVQVAWGSVWDRRLRLSSPAGRVCAPPQRRSLPLAPLPKDRGASTRRA
jgi:hypothetical protein